MAQEQFLRETAPGLTERRLRLDPGSVRRGTSQSVVGQGCYHCSGAGGATSRGTHGHTAVLLVVVFQLAVSATATSVRRDVTMLPWVNASNAVVRTCAEGQARQHASRVLKKRLEDGVRLNVDPAFTASRPSQH